MLARENARRDAEPIEEEEEFFIEKESEDGTRVQVKVDKVCVFGGERGTRTLTGPCIGVHGFDGPTKSGF